MRSFITLVHKELRQNILLFLIPAVVLVLVVIGEVAGFLALGEGWRDILAVTIPVALAVAFGLQTFDLEENDRTRDFLLTKPVTPRQVFWAKYLSGLTLLLLLALAWVGVMTPEAVVFPSFADYSTFWLCTQLFLAVVVYTTCVLTGARIKGPQKVLFGAAFAFAAAVWFFVGFFTIIAVIVHTRGDAGPIWAWIAVASGLALLSFMAAFMAKAACGLLTNTPWRTAGRKLLIFLFGFCLLPPAGFAAGALTRPAVRPFTSLFSTFLGQEEWFTAIAGVKQPGGDHYAFTDAHGRLGLGKKGEKPRVVHEAAGETPLTSLAWSPDGRLVTFREANLIVMFDVEKGQATPVMHGEAALWSGDPQKMLILQADAENEGHYGVYLADLTARTAALKASLHEVAAFDLAWDDHISQLLVLGAGWRLDLVGLDKGDVRSLDLLPYSGCAEVPYAGRFFPAGDDGMHRFAIFAADRAGAAGKRHSTNVYFYELDPRRSTLALAGKLLDVPFTDLAGDPARGELIGLIGLGVYRAVTMPKEGS